MFGSKLSVTLIINTLISDWIFLTSLFLYFYYSFFILFFTLFTVKTFKLAVSETNFVKCRDFRLNRELYIYILFRTRENCMKFIIVLSVLQVFTFSIMDDFEICELTKFSFEKVCIDIERFMPKPK